MANSGRKNDNGSQFFLTFGATSELDGKNTMFGRVAEGTVWNLVMMGDAELASGEGDRPLYPTKIIETEVLINPFEGMVKRERKGGARMEMEKKEEMKKGKKKAGKVLLSFGAEEGDEGEGAPVLRKDKFNTKLVSEGNGAAPKEGMNESLKHQGEEVEKAVRSKKPRFRSPPMPAKPNPESQLPLAKFEEPSRSSSDSPEPAVVEKVSTLLERTNAQIADMKASMKRNIITAPKGEDRKKSALEQMIPETATRGRKRKHGTIGDTPKDKQTLDILHAFRMKLEQAPPELETSQSPMPVLPDETESSIGSGHVKTAADEEEAGLCDLHFIVNCQSCQSWEKQDSGKVQVDDDDGQGWMSHALSFDKDRLGKDLNWKRKNEDDLVVIDPREKTKDIIGERRAQKLAKGSGSTSGRAWDRDAE